MRRDAIEPIAAGGDAFRLDDDEAVHRAPGEVRLARVGLGQRGVVLRRADARHCRRIRNGDLAGCANLEVLRLGTCAMP